MLPDQQVHFILTTGIIHLESHFTYWHHHPHCFAKQTSHPGYLFFIYINQSLQSRPCNFTSKTFLKSNISSLSIVRRLQFWSSVLSCLNYSKTSSLDFPPPEFLLSNIFFDYSITSASNILLLIFPILFIDFCFSIKIQLRCHSLGKFPESSFCAHRKSCAYHLSLFVPLYGTYRLILNIFFISLSFLMDCQLLEDRNTQSTSAQNNVIPSPGIQKVLLELNYLIIGSSSISALPH